MESVLRGMFFLWAKGPPDGVKHDIDCGISRGHVVSIDGQVKELGIRCKSEKVVRLVQTKYLLVICVERKIHFIEY